MINPLRNISTRILVALGAVAILGGACGVTDASDATDESPVTTEGTEATETTGAPVTELEVAAFADQEWEVEVDAIVASDASPVAKVDEVDALAKLYMMTEADITEQTAYLADQVRSRAIVDRAGDKEYMHRVVFVARSIDLAVDASDARADFAFDAYQVARDLARETEEPDSDFITANLDQLDDSIAENGW